MDLGVDDDQLASCVACGLCLPHCPTYRVTGREAFSPRGRIEAMRAVQWRGAPMDEDFVDFMESCVQCRGCEPACPSGVPFGRMIESTRFSLAEGPRRVPRSRRAALAVLGHHRVLLFGSTVLAIAQRMRLLPRRLGIPRVPLRRGPALRSTGSEVWVFTGCVMDAWQREVHRATAWVLDQMGVGYAVTGYAGGCCGALHLHAGLGSDARRLARKVIASMPGDAPIVVNSAGCGAALKDYGHLLPDDAEAARFASRVVDIHEWLAANRERVPASRRRLGPLIIQDPCHLRHVQRVHPAVRTLVGLVADPVELDDDGLCCGAGGAYSILHPEMADALRERKLQSVDRAVQASGARGVVSANPGCSMHLAEALHTRGLEVFHPIEVLAAGLR